MTDYKLKFQDSYKKMKELGESYAQAKGQSWQAQELQKSVLCKLQKFYLEQDKNLAVNRAELESRASLDYEDYVKECALLLTKELQLKCSLEAEKARFEAIRSLCSMEKEIMRETG